MNNQNKPTKFTQNKKKQTRSQNVYVIAVAVLMVISVIVAVVAATSRRDKTEPPKTTATTPATATKDVNPPKTLPETDAGKTVTEEKKPDTTVTSEPTDAGQAGTQDDLPVSGKLPEFAPPVNGKVVKAHSGSTLVFSVTMGDYRVHTGIDIEATSGSPVLAVADGKIAEIWDDPMMGKCVSIEHSGGCVSIYKNLAAELTERTAVGVEVKKGDTIGAVGETSLIETADDTHVHYEMKINGSQVNPEDYIDFSASTISYSE